MPKSAISAVVVTALLVAGCGGGSSSSKVNPNAKEQSPPGDIPDNQVFVAYKPPSGGFAVTVPEGWARRTAGGVTTFTSNLNSVAVSSAAAKRPLTPAQARATLVPRLARTTPGFRLVAINTLQRPAGPALHLVYASSSPPNAVTGKRTAQTVERYLFFRSGREATLTLTGARGADNVDPWRTISSSLRWSG